MHHVRRMQACPRPSTHLVLTRRTPLHQHQHQQHSTRPTPYAPHPTLSLTQG
ncbi:hypothetical protein BDV59DRAFT_170915 [Aspergillus ambiguus]|uniref:uncharacterized protein n=1 Tax=Aspergillus ambiguus TaxID=176160 RepID=UPI003CCD9E00